MSFDPLHKWLGIPPSEQPPNHYQLLGITEFESDPEVIDAAADKQLAFLHDMTNGPRAAIAEDLSNKVSTARLCLCNAAKKAAYDEKLKGSARIRAAGQHTTAEQVNRRGNVASQAARRPSPASVEPQLATWDLRHADGIVHGPYPFESLQIAAREGHIAASTVVRHPTITGNEWVQAFSLPQIADACMLSMPSATSPRMPARRVSVFTRPRPRKQASRWWSQLLASVLPTLVFVVLAGALYRSPHLHKKLTSLWIGETQDVGDSPTDTDSRSPPPSVVSSPPARSVQPNAHRNDDRRLAGARPGIDTSKTVENGSEALAKLETAIEPTLPTHKHQYIDLDLSSPKWTRQLENAGEHDVFLVETVKNSPTGVSTEPSSGQLSRESITLVVFDGIQGLTLELTLRPSADPAVVNISGRYVVGGDDFRMTVLLKRWNEVGRRLKTANTTLHALMEQRGRLQTFLHSRGEKPLTAVNQAENQWIAINQRMPALVMERDALQRTWEQTNSLVQKVKLLDDRGELVIRSMPREHPGTKDAELAEN